MLLAVLRDSRVTSFTGGGLSILLDASDNVVVKESPWKDDTQELTMKQRMGIRGFDE